MNAFPRTDPSLLGLWWWTVDRWTVAALVIIVSLGVILSMAASPPVAEHLGLDQFYFVRRQFAFLPIILAVTFAVSFLDPGGVRTLALLCFIAALFLLGMTLVAGVEIKGATRWISLFGLSLQPSEFVKPGFAVVTAWIFAAWRSKDGYPGHLISIGLYLCVAGLLLAQPDFGMTILVSMVWGVQFFLAGLPIILVCLIALFFLGGGIGAYFTLDHVRERIDRFFDPAGSEAYQVSRSLEAFTSGGLFGVGPGEGRIKTVLPDAHADFVFAVAGEEFGLVTTLLIVGLFAFVVLRGLARALGERDLFVQLAVAGLLVQFGLQAIINMASTINLMPTKGITLPFISYGGSSIIALSLSMGMVLALTRQRPEREQLP